MQDYGITTMADWNARADENLRIIAKEPHKLGWLCKFEKLNRLHSVWINYIWESNKPRALQAYRGGYKTTAISIVGSIRWMLFHPNDRILIARKKFNDAAEVVSSIAQAMDTQEIKELFRQAHGQYPKATVRRSGNLTYNFKNTITPEGNITGMGIDQGITGHHYDKIINDDIITLQDRLSRADRERSKEAVREIAANVIEPGKGSGWIGTPWDKDDAWNDILRFTGEIAKYPLSQYSFMGEEAVELKRRSTTPFLFNANYELRIDKDETRMFNEPRFPHSWDYSVRGAVAQLDTAFDGSHYCALTIAAPTHKEASVETYQAVGFTYAGNVEDWEEQIIKYCAKYRVTHIWVESNADKGACAKRLSNKGLRVNSYTEGMNKHIKISAHLYHVWNNIEWAAETDEEYISQVTEYREGVQPDDAPDSAASLFRQEFSKNNSTLSAETKRLLFGS